MKNVFLDTNIFIDFISHRGEFYEPVALIVSLGIQEKIHLQVSSLSFATASYILSQHHKWDTSQIVREFESFINICKVTTVDETVVRQAVSVPFMDFEDGMQHYSAMSFSSDFIITRNSDDFSESQITVMEPNEFLDLWEQEHQDE